MNEQDFAPFEGPGDDPRGPREPCEATKATLRELWVDTVPEFPYSSAPGDEGMTGASQRASDDNRAIEKFAHGSVLEHIDTCPHCRHEAHELERLGRSLKFGFAQLGSAFEAAREENVEAALQRMRETPSATMLRRVRRPLRFVLWVGFLAFTLIACLLLAAALRKAIGIV